jgi:hypothetical protein
MTWSATAGRLIVIDRVVARPTHRAAEAAAAKRQAVLCLRASSACMSMTRTPAERCAMELPFSPLFGKGLAGCC